MSQILGKDGSNIVRPIACSTAGHLLVDTNGDADTTVKCMGSEDGATTGTQHQLKVGSDGSGIVKSAISSVDGTAQSIQVDGAGALIVRTDNSNDSIRITGLNSVGNNKGIGVEDTDGGILGAGKVLVATPSHTDGTRQILRLNVAGELMVNDSSGGGGGSTQYAVATTGMGSGTGTLMIGSASGSAKEVNLSTAGSIHTKEKELQNEGTTGNANPATGTSMAPGTYSLVVDISNMREASILYNDASTASFDGLDIEVSADGGTYYRLDGIYPFQVGSVRTAYRGVSLHGLTHLRLKNVSSTDTYTSVSGTIVGCP